MHLVSSSGQHHLISQPAQVAVLHTISQSGSSSANPHPTSTIPTCSGLAVPFTATQGTGAVLEFILVRVQPVSWVPNYLLLSRACAWVFWHGFFVFCFLLHVTAYSDGLLVTNSIGPVE